MSKKAAKELFQRNQVIEAKVYKFSNVLETFNQHLAEKEKKKDKREEKRIQAWQEIFWVSKAWQEMKELEIKRQEHEIRNEEHLIMTTNISHLDPQIKAYYIMRKNEIFAKWSANVSNPNYNFPLPPDE
ncbi:unnamed protein product [Camellia sinensis]